jgi:galactokinase
VATPEVAVASRSHSCLTGCYRVRHVATENRRVLDDVSALRQNDLSRFGKLLTESHASLRDDYQVSVPELDTLIGIAQETPGVLGARLTGRRLRRLRRGRGHSRRSRGGQYRDHRTLP